MATVVIAGAGQAGYQTAAGLRQDGFDGRVVLVGDEPGLPYQRPPLSKTYLSGHVTADGVRLRGQEFFADNGIELVTGHRITGIDRAARRVRLDSGDVDYDHLVLALGACNRPLPVPGADLPGVVGLRTVAEADVLRDRLSSVRDVVVVGAGFIGLEFASVARDAGVAVTVVEAKPRVLSRVVSEPTSEFFARLHSSRGVRLLLGTGVARVLGEERATGVETTDGSRIEADLVVVAIGVRPNTELAEQAGLAVDDGVVVDEHLRTCDPAISAIGDCARFPTPHADAPVRLESVQNAIDQARCVSASLTGNARAYAAVPWFWSDQGSAKLQIAGLTTGHDRTIVRGDVDEGRFSVFCYRGKRLLGAESVSRAADHMAVRRLLTAEAPLDPEQAADPSFDLKSYSRGR
ncbi:NAD(P)/FAD-dependent oxidoreductase [Saccharopolyspora rosea]|uniref:NAD(P)/FAD-dependent oxidoreductase n=1 Tax=Saccharopolyspora rosea TaxID=524884 RepID=UPI0021D97981|nr:FAD-dependent oxidoreductase [Saccharopolyspora rosea]